MHNPPSSTLRSLRQSSSLFEHALTVAALVRPLVDAIQRKDRDLASQVRRAVNSIGLNCAEAQGSAAGNARLRFESALGSLYEAQAGVQLAIVWGYFTRSAAVEALESMNHLGARLYGIARR